MIIRETAYNEIFDAQRHFRSIMDSMARPGKINTLSEPNIDTPEGLNKASALVGFALLNADVTFFSGTYPETVNEYFYTNTSSKGADATTADFIFINGRHDTSAIEEAKEGIDIYPETSAFIVIDAEKVSTTPLKGSIAITLTGSGVETKALFYIKGISSDLLDIIKEKNTEYPLGVETIFTDQQDQVVCIPRSSHIEHHEVS